jgi:hypothetical protein
MRNIEDEVKDALRQVGNEILAKWRTQVPVDTGKLKRSLQFRVIGGASLALSFYYTFYGVYVDLGTYGNADDQSFGISPFRMPAYNARPGRGGFGIRPRYWTSLSDPEFQDQILNTITENFETAVGERVFDSLDALRTSTKTKSTPA